MTTCLRGQPQRPAHVAAELNKTSCPSHPLSAKTPLLGALTRPPGSGRGRWVRAQASTSAASTTATARV
jgi:hypothetical protein